MNAYLTNRPELTPIPAPSGFSIESPSAICTAAISTPMIDQYYSDGNMCIDGAPIQLLPSESHLDNLQKAFSLAEDDPYLPLCVRTSSLESSNVRLNDSASKSSDSEEELGDTGDCTVDSLGPCTPPRLSCGPIPSNKCNPASKDLPGPAFNSLSSLTEDNELISFIDFTGSFFEDVDLAIMNDYNKLACLQ